MNAKTNQLPSKHGHTDFFRLVRLPNLLIIVLTQYMSRIFLIGPKEEWLAHLGDLQFALLSLSTVMIGAAGYIINDYYDIKIDMINKPSEVVVGRSVRRRVAMFAHTLLNLLAIGIGFSLSTQIGLVNLLAAFWLWLYSNQLKRMPLIGNLSIAALTALAVLVVGLYAKEHSVWIYIYASFAFYITVIREIIKDTEDMKGDMEFGCRTVPIVWGIRRTKRLLLVLTALFSITNVGLILYGTQGVEWINLYAQLMLIPIGIFIYLLTKAYRKNHFHRLSQLCKWIMLCGVIGMTLI